MAPGACWLFDSYTATAKATLRRPGRYLIRACHLSSTTTMISPASAARVIAVGVLNRCVSGTSNLSNTSLIIITNVLSHRLARRYSSGARTIGEQSHSGHTTSQQQWEAQLVVLSSWTFSLDLTFTCLALLLWGFRWSYRAETKMFKHGA